MSLDPLAATQAISESYRRYLATTFRFQDARLQEQFEAGLAVPDRFMRGPILEATPPFQLGRSIEDLIAEGLLSAGLRKLNQQVLPAVRPLYRHQEEAIRKSVALGRNLVVATGTGSGKTEAFLIPIINHLMNERAAGTLSPGVRALLLYPMNALANDQVKRLHELLTTCPDITFGRYTGETADRQAEALRAYRQTYQREPLPNELISREAMRESPPHILLTNYAMLEYLLLRPRDNVFFDGKFAGHWRFLVLDEAHTYGGAKGIETAMLLRRLKDRVLRPGGRLQCMATSATLGRGEADYVDVARFATRLFGEEFTYDMESADKRDVVQAARLPLSSLQGTRWRPPGQMYQAMQSVLNEERADSSITQRLRSLAEQHGASDELLAGAEMSCARGDVAAYLHDVLRHDANLADLRQALEDRPQPLADLARKLFGDQGDACQMLTHLVSLAVQAKPSAEAASLLPARYHLFVRAIEGAYLALHPTRPLYLEREESVAIDGSEYRVFEVGICTQCGAMYLVGETRPQDGRKRLCHPGQRYVENAGALEFYLLTDQGVPDTPENEDEEVASEGQAQPDQSDYQVCPKCGAIDRAGLLGLLCSCLGAKPVPLLKVDSPKGFVTRCPACGNRSSVGLVRRFLTGNDATASVLATALYQCIPPRPSEDSADQVTAADDAWDAPYAPGPTATGSTGGRQLLVFSDSRQDAAFFAPYLQRSYHQLLRRRMILKVLDEKREQAIAYECTISDLANALRTPIRDSGLLGPNASVQEAENAAWQWLLYELLAMDRRNSLEGLGLLGFVLPRPRGWTPPPELTQKWGLTDDEALGLFRVLLDGLRVRGAVLFPDGVSPEDELFQPRNREYYFRQRDSSASHRVMAWHPGSRTNTRLDYLERLTTQGLGLPLGRDKCGEALNNIWDPCLKPGSDASPWGAFFSAVNPPQAGPVYRLRYDCWCLRPSTIDTRVEWYQCDTCQSLTLHNVRGVCPTFRCQGRLQRCDPDAVFRDNHYRRLYSRLQVIDMRSEEHTAQLTGERAAELQARFMAREVDVLSCSTTFELGVDVGELESVFMRNVPPSAANYVQRAGRAGRRTDAAAFALTFAQRRAHDLAHFREPERMVSGRIGAPHFELANEKIARRHLHAVALAAFWREQPGAFGDVEAFFLANDGRVVADLRAYLATHPEPLRQALLGVLPPDLAGRLEIHNWGWLAGLVGDDGSLTRAEAVVRGEVQQLEVERRRLFDAGRRADHILHILHTIKERNIIGSLATQGVLPKYGFPVDVVSLQIQHHGDAAKGLELERDLRIALSEYAPSGEVVAGGKLWTSRYLKRMPDRTWTSYYYAICPHCHSYQSVLTEGAQPFSTCAVCRSGLAGRDRGEFLVPEFGFVADLGAPRRPGEARPERTHTTRTHFSGKGAGGGSIRLDLPGGSVLAQPVAEAWLAAVNTGRGRGFQICPVCGYALLGGEQAPPKHKTPWGTDCGARLSHRHLGHEYQTDVLLLRFDHSDGREGFWPSLLYGVLEGAADALDIDRGDIDGCLYPWEGNPLAQEIVLFDDVPGGAGHVRRLADSESRLRLMLCRARERLEACECGQPDGETSCYGCLRNYRNQFYHDVLRRGPVMRFLADLGA